MSESKNEDILDLRLSNNIVQARRVNKDYNYLLVSVFNFTTGGNLIKFLPNAYNRIDSNLDTNVIIVNNSDYPIGWSTIIRQVGSGAITITKGEVNVKVNGGLTTNGAGTCVQVIKVKDFEWDIIGGIDV